MTRVGEIVRSVVRSPRGSAQLGLVLAAAAVVGGMTVGQGVASRQTSAADAQAWLGDGPRGQVVQVDPVLGRANVRLQVARPGSHLVIQQGDGTLVVQDRSTGVITSIDLGTLLVGGARTATPGKDVKVLLAGDRLYVADLARGTVQAVDPATQADVGRPWSAGHPLVDVGTDGAHDVWALDDSAALVHLRWDGSGLQRVDTRTVDGAGPGSVVVGHDRGVTVVGSRGAVVRVGTGSDGRLDAPSVSGPLAGPGRSPAGLVPVSSPGTSSVVIVGPHDAVVDDVSGYGCERPGTPTVFDGKVYVPCLGAKKVLVLAPGGGQAGAAIPTPAGDAQLTVSGGRLVVDVPGSGRATVVDGAGARHDFPTVAPGVGVQDPRTPPPAPPDPPTPSPSPDRGHDNGHDNGHGHDTGHDTGHANANGNDTGGTRPQPGGGPSGGTPSGTAAAPGGGATASARPDGSVLVTWDGGRGATTVTATATGEEVASVPDGADQATVTVLTPGTTTAFTVRNTGFSATTNTVTTSTRPGAVGPVRVVPQGVSGGVATLAVTWTAAAGNGASVSYAVATSGAPTTTTAGLNTTLRVPCPDGCSGTVTVTPRNAAGGGVAATGTYSVGGTPAPAPQPQPQPQPDPTTAAPPAAPTTQAPPPQVAMPSSGANLVTTTATVGSDTAGTWATAHVTVTAPADWAAFPGTCTLQDDQGGSVPVPCNATGFVRDYEYGETGDHQYWVVASDSGRTVESARATQHVVYRTLCLNSAGARSLTGGGALQRPVCDTQPDCPPSMTCQIPFTGRGWDPDAAEPAVVTLRRAPWGAR